MTLAHPLQLEQLQLFWESFPPALGVCLREFLTILPEAWLTVSALIHLKGVLSGWVQDCAGQSSSSTPNWLIHVFMDLALCTGAQSCWNRKGPSPNCFHKVWSVKLSKKERPVLSQIFVEAVCSMPRCFNLYTCGHGSNYNSWNKFWVS